MWWELLVGFEAPIHAIKSKLPQLFTVLLLLRFLIFVVPGLHVDSGQSPHVGIKRVECEVI